MLYNKKFLQCMYSIDTIIIYLASIANLAANLASNDAFWWKERNVRMGLR